MTSDLDSRHSDSSRPSLGHGLRSRSEVKVHGWDCGYDARYAAYGEGDLTKVVRATSSDGFSGLARKFGKLNLNSNLNLGKLKTGLCRLKKTLCIHTRKSR